MLKESPATLIVVLLPLVSIKRFDWQVISVVPDAAVKGAVGTVIVELEGLYYATLFDARKLEM